MRSLPTPGKRGFHVIGIDDNHRAIFFGPEGDTRWVLDRCARRFPATAMRLWTSNREGSLILLRELRPDLIVHGCAALTRPRGLTGKGSGRCSCSLPALFNSADQLGNKPIFRK
jgi:hypothetical protein